MAWTVPRTWMAGAPADSAAVPDVRPRRSEVRTTIGYTLVFVGIFIGMVGALLAAPGFVIAWLGVRAIAAAASWL